MNKPRVRTFIPFCDTRAEKKYIYVYFYGAARSLPDDGHVLRHRKSMLQMLQNVLQISETPLDHRPTLPFDAPGLTTDPH